METFKERQERENRLYYEKWLSCGFQGEMKVDKNGWCFMGTTLKGDGEIAVFDKGFNNKASISYMQLPNGKWISGTYAFCRTHGHAYGLSIWNTQFDTKEEAIYDALERVEKEIDEKDKKTLMKKVAEVRNGFKKDILIVPTITEQFEQVSLF